MKTKEKKEKKTEVMKFRATNYPVGDFMIRIKNAFLSGKKEIELPNLEIVAAVAGALKRAGFLEKVERTGEKLLLSFTYKNKQPIISGLKLISKPGLRVYKSIAEIGQRKEKSLLVLSTSKGVLTSKEGLAKGCGGEVIVEVW